MGQHAAHQSNRSNGGAPTPAQGPEDASCFGALEVRVSSVLQVAGALHPHTDAREGDWWTTVPENYPIAAQCLSRRLSTLIFASL